MLHAYSPAGGSSCVTTEIAVRRLLQEVKELQREPSSQFVAYPLEDNLFEWHFTIRGPKDTSFEGGRQRVRRYHGRLLLPNDYPFKPPNIIMLTPNGRFELNKKICLSITGYHPEYWQPAWGVRTAMLALISFLPTQGESAIGALDYTDDERRVLARRSVGWRCSACQDNDVDYM
ncbi:ubiquitin-conjugating enzyme/RWD-like protein, partial [Thamnocephalis sphaerospora]